MEAYDSNLRTELLLEELDGGLGMEIYDGGSPSTRLQGTSSLQC